MRLLAAAPLTSLQTKASTLNRLIDDLYELLLADVDALAFYTEPLDSTDTVCSAMQGFVPRLMEKRIALQLNVSTVPSHSTMVKDNVQHLQQVTQNLLGNTLRCAGAGDTLCVYVC